MTLFEQIILDNKSLSSKLHDIISDYDIYCELIGYTVQVGTPINSPLREDDTVPSFSLFIPTRYAFDYDAMWWRDFAGDKGNVFDFIQKWADYNENVFLSGRYEIIRYIDTKLGLGLFDKVSVVKPIIRRDIDYEALKVPKALLYTSRPFTHNDLYWWSKYAIDEEMLKLFNVKSVLYLLREDYTISKTNSTFDLTYAYNIYDGVKLYFPTEAIRRWLNNCPSSYIMGEEQMEGKDVIIITKSMKDIMTFKSFIDCDSISTQAETQFLPEWYINNLKANYKHIFVVMDYDATGIKAAEHYKDTYELSIVWVSTEAIKIGSKFKPVDKDISDFVHNNGIEKTFQKLKEMFPTIDSYIKYNKLKYLKELFIKYD